MTLSEFIELCKSNSLIYKLYNSKWVTANISNNYMEPNYWLLAYSIENNNTYLAGNISIPMVIKSFIQIKLYIPLLISKIN